MADLLTRLIEAGTPAALVAEVAMLAARAEAASAADPVAERRRQWDREYRASRRAAEKSALSGGSGECRVDSADNADAAPAPDKRNPQTPKKINPTPGVCVAHEADPISVRADWRIAANALAAAVLSHLARQARERLAIDGAVFAWNAMAKRANLPTIARLTDERRRRLQARLAEHGPDAFTEAIQAVERSSFCRGDSERGWRADFDFLLQPKSFNRLIEGSYDRAPQPASARAQHRSSGADEPASPYIRAEIARRNGGLGHVQ